MMKSFIRNILPILLMLTLCFSCAVCVVSAEDLEAGTEPSVAEPVEGTTAETAPAADAETIEDLGPAFSGARVSYALRMTLLGMGMVFAVLALLWLILAIFKAALSGKSDKPRKSPEAEKPAVTVVESAPTVVADDGATIAAITAAIAAMIESDPDLSAQFVGGFRVVSFKKKSGKTAWNR